MIRKALITSAMFGGAMHAMATPITASMTGAWYDPSRSGQGIQIQIVGTAQKDVLLNWYTFDASGNPIWLVAQAPITDDVVRLTALQVRGPRFMQQGAQVNYSQFAELELSFDDCNKGKLRYSSALGIGELPLTRLSKTFGDQCTGTFVDDRRPTETLQTDQSSASAGLNISTRYREEPGKVRFKVTARGPASAIGNRYQVWILGAARAQIQMLSSGGESEAEVEFASPAEPGKLPLSFDPRNAAVELRPIGASGPGVTPPAPGPINAAPPFGSSNQRVPLRFSASFAAGSGDAQLERLSNKVNFDVEIEDVPIGVYSVQVGGVHRGNLLVSMQNGRNKGELEFSNPQDAGKPLLNFDPRGQLIQIKLGAETIASVIFVN